MIKCPQCHRSMKRINQSWVQCDHCEYSSPESQIIEMQNNPNWTWDRTTPEQEEDLYRAEKKYDNWEHGGFKA